MATTAGIDIGSEAIKGVVLNTARNGKTEVVAAGMLPIGDLARMEDSADKTLAMGVKLNELVKGARLSAQTRRVGAGGKATSIRFLQVPPVPPWRLDMLVKYEVEEKSGEKEPIAYDYQILGIPEVSGQYTVLIGTCREAASADLLQTARSAGLGEVEIDLEALALFSAYYHGHGYDIDKTVVIADIGADDMTVLLCRNGDLWFARTILGGGRRLTQVIADELKIDPAEAEQLKRTQAEISFDLAPAPSVRTRIGGTIVKKLTQILPKADRSGVTRIDPAASGSAAAPAPASAGPSASLFAGGGDGSKTSGIANPILSSGRIPMPASSTIINLSKKSDATDAGATPAVTADTLPGSDDLFMLDAPIPAAPATPAASVSLGSADAGSSMDELPPSLESIEAASAAPAAAPEGAPKDTLELQGAPALVTAAAAPAEGSVASAPAASVWDDKTKKQVSAALVREAASICAALENAVLFTKQQTKLRDLKIDRVYLTGGGSRVKGLQEFMARRMRMEVVPLEPLRQISLERLPAEQATSLKSEQHSLAVSLGLALAHHKGTFSFLLWPAALEKKKIFWARGAYLYYAAAMVAAAVGLFLFTPYRNSQALVANNIVAKQMVQEAQDQSKTIGDLLKENDEKRHRFEQIGENISSGDKFLNILAELKARSTKDMKGRIPDDVYITSISTHVPRFLDKMYNQTTGANGTATPQNPGAHLGPKGGGAAADTQEDTFQEQRRIYIRGFAVSTSDTDLERKVKVFWDNLVPVQKQPDHPDNLFTDVYDIWYGKPQSSGSSKLYEFVLELYTAGARDEATGTSDPRPLPARRIRGGAGPKIR